MQKEGKFGPADGSLQMLWPLQFPLSHLGTKG